MTSDLEEIEKRVQRIAADVEAIKRSDRGQTARLNKQKQVLYACLGGLVLLILLVAKSGKFPIKEETIDTLVNVVALVATSGIGVAAYKNRVIEPEKTDGL